MKTSLSQQPTTKVSDQVLDLISRDPLQEICAAKGPFVTVYLPARHPGAADSPSVERMRTLLREASDELSRRRFLEPMDPILDPLRELAKNSEGIAGGRDSVVFASPGLFRHFALGAPTTERLIVAAHPQITPILSSLIPQPEFYVLAVTKKLLKLGRWRDGVCTEVSMPAEVSTSFEDTLISERPDHDLQSHSPSGPSSQVGSTRFGTGSERESVHGRLRRYFQTVDQHLADFLNGAPLVLVGIEQELAAYRSEARYAHVLLAEPTSPAHLSFAELGRLGQAAVLQKQRADADKVLRDFRESVRRDHVVIGIREVLEAAYEGRVHKLLMERNARHDGLLGPLFPESLRLEGQQDLINAAAVETIKHHGEVYVIDAGELGSCPVAAILRFATPSGALHGNR